MHKTIAMVKVGGADSHGDVADYHLKIISSCGRDGPSISEGLIRGQRFIGAARWRLPGQ